MPRPRLPLDEQAVLTAYAAGNSINQVAQTLGVDRSRITRVVDEHGVRRDDRGRHWATRPSTPRPTPPPKTRKTPTPRPPRTPPSIFTTYARRPALRGMFPIADALYERASS